MANKKYVGPEVAQAIAGAVSACDRKIKDSSSKVWELYPGNIDEVTSESPSGAITMMSFPTPADLLEHIAEIKEGDVIDITKLLGYDNQDGEYFRLQVTSTNLEITGDTIPNRYAAMASMIQGGMALSAIIDVETCGIVMVTLADTSTVDASLGGSGWSSGPIPNWGDADSYWNISDMQQLQLGKRFHSALTPSGVSSSATGDPVKDASGNYVDGIVVGKGKTENSEYCVVLGAAKFKTDNNAGTMTAPGIFYVTQKNKTLSTTPGKVRFFPLLNMWKEIKELQTTVNALNPGEWFIGPEKPELIKTTKIRSKNLVHYEYLLSETLTAEMVENCWKGHTLVLDGFPYNQEVLNEREFFVRDFLHDENEQICGFIAESNLTYLNCHLTVDYSGLVKIDYYPAIEERSASLRREASDANAKPARVIVGRIPKIGHTTTHNYYLTYRTGLEDRPIIVNLITNGFRKWCGDETSNAPFCIKAVGVKSVFLSKCHGTSDSEATKTGPFNISIEGDLVTISKKVPGICYYAPYGLFAEMSIYTPPNSCIGPDSADGRVVVRYDEQRGWVGCQPPTKGGHFVYDKCLPPTYKEVKTALGSSDLHKCDFQIQFRSRSVRPKGVAASDATKKYQFWSYKKKRGSVFRIRRTLNAYSKKPRYNDGDQTISYAHRSLCASEWHYYSVKWESLNIDGMVTHRVVALRRLG